MRNLEPRSKYSMARRLLSATLCLSAGGGSATAALANVPQPTNAMAWQNAVPAHAFGGHFTADGGGFASSLAHAVPAHLAGSNNSASTNPYHWLPSLHAAFQTATAPTPAMRAVMQSAPGASDINLYSPVAQFAAGSLAGFHTITIDVGGKQQQLDFDSKLTGAELLAAEQVLAGGKQTLVVSASGVATGGTFNLNNNALAAIDGAVGGKIGSLDVSRGVTLVDGLSSLNLVGSLVNFGTITVGSGAHSQLLDTINAANIYNAASGAIAAKNTDLSLIATGDIVNQGAISTGRNLNVLAQTVTNSGLLSSALGNITFSGVGAGDINLNGTGGTVQALKGDIDFNAAGASNVTVNGGNYLSQQLNFNAGCGTVNAQMGEVTGMISGTAGASHISAATANLRLGNIANAGDPTYYNSVGDVTIDGAITSTSGADLAIIASGNIIANGGTINTSQTGGNSGSVTLVAGTSVTPSGSGSPSTQIDLLGPSLTGGYIDLSGITYTGTTKNLPVTQITTASATGNSGNVVMVAYAGSGTNSGNIQATATAGQKGGASTIDTTHVSSAATGGDVTIIGGGQAINAQNISTSPSATVSILGQAAVASGGSVSVKDGTLIGSFSTTPTLSAPTNITFGTITAGNVSITTGGAVLESKGGNVSADTISMIAASVGSAKAPFNVNAQSSFDIFGLGPASGTGAPAPIYINDGSGGGTLGGAGAPGQSITITEAGDTMVVGNLNYTNVTLVNASKSVSGGDIIINPQAIPGFQIGEIYSSAGNPTDALGTGTITITASGNIIQNAGNNNLANIVGKNVILTSTGGSIGDSDTPLNIQGAFLTANAAKGSVFINDTVQTTLNAGSAALVGTAPGGGTYSVTGNGLAVAGVINGYNIALAAGPASLSDGPSTALVINANVGSTKTNSISLTSLFDIDQTNSKAFLQAANVALQGAGGIGSSQQPIATKAGTLQITGSEDDNPYSGTVDVKQSGNVTLLASMNGALNNGARGNLNLTVSGVLTLGSTAQEAYLDYGTVNLTAPTVVINGGADSFIAAKNLTFLSPSALTITGSAPATFQVTNLAMVAGSTVTVGAKDGSLNPLSASLFDGSASAVTNFLVIAKGNFTSPISSFATNHSAQDQQFINMQIGNLVTSAPTGASLATVHFDTSGVTGADNAGNIVLGFSGSQAVNLGTASGNFQLTDTGRVGLISVIAKGPLNIDGGGLISGSSVVDLNSSKIVFGLNTPVNLILADLSVASPSVTVNSGSTVNVVLDTTFTAKGTLSINGGGTVNLGQTLTLGSAETAGISYVTTSITLGAAKGGAGNPLLAALAGTGPTALSDLTIATTGALLTANSGFALDSAAPGAINITAANLVNTSSTPSMVPFLIAADSTGAGVTPGTVTVNLTGSQAFVMGNHPGNLEISATNLSDPTAGGNSVSVTSKGNLTAQFNSVATSSNSSVSLTSTAGAFIEENAGGTTYISVGPNTNLTLSGAKYLSITGPALFDPNVTSLTLTSGSTAPLLLTGAVITDKQNGISDGIGTFQAGVLSNLTINTGGGITIDGTATINVTPTGNLTFNSKGQETILGATGSITPGVSLSINAPKGIQLGDSDPMDKFNPFNFLTLASDPIDALQLVTQGTFKMAFDQIYVGVAGAAANANANNVNMNAQTNAIQTNSIRTNSILPADVPAGAVNLGLTLTAKDYDPTVPNSNSTFEGVSTFLITIFEPRISAPNGFASPLDSSTANGVVNITFTGPQNLVLGPSNAPPSGTTRNIVVDSLSTTNPTAVSVSTKGTLTVGDGTNAGITMSGPGSIALSSTGAQIVNTGGISTGANAFGLSLSSAKSLAVLDANLLNNPALTSVSLASAGSFVVGATGTITNGTAGAIAAPVVTITVPTLTNNLSINGAGSGATLNLGAAGKSAFTIVAGTGTFGELSPFENLNITSSGNVTLSNLFRTDLLLGDGSVANINISGPTVNGVLQPVGTLTFSPNAINVIAGADSVTGNGGSITITAKSLVYNSVGNFLFETFDASAKGSNGSSGTVSIETTSALTLGTAKGNIQINVGAAGDGGTINLTSAAGTLTIAGPGLTAGATNLFGNNIAINAPVTAPGFILLQTNGKSGSGVITQQNIADTITTHALFLSQGSAKISATPLTVQAQNLTFTFGAFNIVNSASAGTMAVGGTVNSLTLNTTNNQVGGATLLTGLSSTNGSIIVIDHTPVANLQTTDFASFTATNGSILFEVANDVSGASITVGESNLFHASGTAPGVGQVSIVIGALPTAANLIAGLTPGDSATAPGKTETVGGNVYLGNTRNTGGTYNSNNNESFLMALGRNIVINEGVSGAIELSGNDSITADPPVGASSAVSATASAAASLVTLPMSPPNLFSGLSPGSSFSPAIVQPASPISVINTQAIDAHKQLFPEYLSKQKSFGNSNILDQGVKLIAPERDITIETKFGQVSIAAHAVVMLMAFEGGIAIYNLHDDRPGAVLINRNTAPAKVAPGHALVLTNRSVRCFEEINPAQSVGYRHVVGLVEEGGVRVFRGEFYIPSMLTAAGPLKQFATSKESAKVTKAMLKTSAILSMYGGATPFQLMSAPTLTAMAEH